MNRRHVVPVLVLLGSTLSAVAVADEPPPPQPAALSELAWLAGHWINEFGETRLEEVWLEPVGSSMVGVNRTVMPGGKVSFEYLRIEARDDGIVYLASPDGSCPPTVFRLHESRANWVEFTNPDHDFPQRIIYRRTGNVLAAGIEGTVDGKRRASEWRWKLKSGE
jgi:hypothetical protein